MPNTDFDKWVAEIGRWQAATNNIPALVRDDIVKSKIKFDKPEHGVKSLLVDPLQVQYALGYKDRKYSLTYDVLKRIPHQLGIVAAILQIRCNQAAAFSVPFRASKSVGFMVKHRDPGHEITESEKRRVEEIERFIYNCGAPDPNPHNPAARDDFETFLKKITRDSLMYDQATFEVVPDRRGQPYEFMAVDASTVRIASPNQVLGLDETYQHRPLPVSAPFLNSGQFSPFRTMHAISQNKNKRPEYIQLINGQICNVYFKDELAFGVRNPRTDIYIQGYGYGEMEQLITILTAHLYAEEYNRRFFMQGSAPKGILNFRGENFTQDQLEAFKRQWRANLEGVENSWKTPILQAEQGIDWIDMHPSNREMEYGQWLEYLLKVTCAVFLIDPAELNFDLHGGVQQTPLFESSQEWKLKASRDRGLKPLLRFLAKLINKHIVSKLDDRFVFDFVGLDELTEQEKHQLRQEQVSSYMTLNEIRRAEDLPDVEDGDTILNPTYLQARQARIQQEQQKEAQKQAGANAPAGNQPQEAEAAQEPEEAPEDVPAYAGSFSKSLTTSSFSLDDYKGLFTTK